MNNTENEIDAGLLPADLSEDDIDALYFKMMERDEYHGMMREDEARMKQLEHRAVY